MSNLTTLRQGNALRELGYNSCERITVDEAIDWLRRKFHVIIYDATEPFVDPISNKIVYSYKVKFCNVHWGWNQRERIGQSKWSPNSYAMKRQAIWIAIRYLKKRKERKAKILKLKVELVPQVIYKYKPLK